MVVIVWYLAFTRILVRLWPLVVHLSCQLFVEGLCVLVHLSARQRLVVITLLDVQPINQWCDVS